MHVILYICFNTAGHGNRFYTHTPHSALESQMLLNDLTVSVVGSHAFWCLLPLLTPSPRVLLMHEFFQNANTGFACLAS